MANVFGLGWVDEVIVGRRNRRGFGRLGHGLLSRCGFSMVYWLQVVGIQSVGRDRHSQIAVPCCSIARFLDWLGSFETTRRSKKWRTDGDVLWFVG